MRYRPIVVCSALAFVSCLGATAQVKKSSEAGALPQVLLRQAEEHRFPQTKLGNCDGNAPSAQSFGRTNVKVDPGGDVLLEGTDLQGRPWSASMETAPVATCEIWQADLNADGQDDLIVISFGTNSSGGWDTNLSLLLFDKDGRPFPWQATGNFHLSDSGINEIVSMQGSDAAGVIVPQREGELGNGYRYAYNAFSVVGDRVVKKRDKAWPLFIAPDEAIRAHQSTNTLSTDVAHALNRIGARVQSLTGSNDEDRLLILSDGHRIQEPRMVMVDGPNGSRTIQFAPQLADLQRLVAEKAAVQAIGTSCDEEQCQPLLLWATL